MTQITFEDIARMVEYIPITGSLPNSGRLKEGETMDSNFLIKEEDDLASKLALLRKGAIRLRDIIRVFSLYLKDINWKVLVSK
jgi:hypothetical protein